MPKKYFRNIGRKSPTMETSEALTSQQSEMFTCLPEVIRASHFPTPGSEEAKQMTATSGRQCSMLSKQSGPLGSLLKTLLVTSKWDSTKCSLIWKATVTPHNRLLFQLVPLEHFSIESGYGLSPTPMARDYRDVSKTNVHLSSRERHTPSLATECALRGMTYCDIPEAYALVMGYPSRWCEVKSNVTAMPSIPKSPIVS